MYRDYSYDERIDSRKKSLHVYSYSEPALRQRE